VSSGFGAEELAQEYASKHVDDYNSILVKALADRLAEGFAEVLHLEVRKIHWGYAPNENLTLPELLKVKYQGIRPACGYPSQPDHDEKVTLWNLFDIEKETGITLTDSSYMMIPPSSVCGLYIAHGSYFGVGEITKEQMTNYANRKGKEISYCERLMPNVVGYTN